MIEKFRTQMKKDGRNFRWFHREYLSGVSYAYFIIQLNDPERLQDSIKVAIKKYLNGEKS